MARLPSWREELPQDYTSARKWGTGINPIHAKKSGYEGRNTGPDFQVPGDTGLVNPAILDLGYVDDAVPGMGEDFSYMEAHPNLGDIGVRGTAETQPPWGHGSAPTPQGTISRILKRGKSPRSGSTQQKPNALGGDGYESKLVGELNDSEVSDDAQLLVQTSRRQRDAVRNNTAATLRGTDADRWDIPSRVPGMRVPSYSGGPRHVDMEPKSQEYLPRPWKYRGVGTGDVSWMSANEVESVTPIRREIPPDVFQGASETSDVYASDDYDWY